MTHAGHHTSEEATPSTSDSPTTYFDPPSSKQSPATQASAANSDDHTTQQQGVPPAAKQALTIRVPGKTNTDEDRDKPTPTTAMSTAPSETGRTGALTKSALRHTDLKREHRDRNLFVFHLPPDWNDKELEEHFGHFGTVVSCRVVKKQDGTTRGFGFVLYETPEEAKTAVLKMNGYTIQGKRLKVEFKKTPEETRFLWNSLYQDVHGQNILVRPSPLPDHTHTQHYHHHHQHTMGGGGAAWGAADGYGGGHGYGYPFDEQDHTLTTTPQMYPYAHVHPYHYSAGYPFPHPSPAAQHDSPFSHHNHPAHAPSPRPLPCPSVVPPASPTSLFDLDLTLKAHVLNDREEELRSQRKVPAVVEGGTGGEGRAFSGSQEVSDVVGEIHKVQGRHGPRGCNIFVFHVPAAWNDDKLRELFGKYGRIVSLRVARNDDGNSRGYAFVNFDNPISALHAITGMDGFSVEGKRLKVQLKRGEEQFARAYLGAPPLAPSPSQFGNLRLAPTSPGAAFLNYYPHHAQHALSRGNTPTPSPINPQHPGPAYDGSYGYPHVAPRSFDFSRGGGGASPSAQGLPHPYQSGYPYVYKQPKPSSGSSRMPKHTPPAVPLSIPEIASNGHEDPQSRFGTSLPNEWPPYIPTGYRSTMGMRGYSRYDELAYRGALTPSYSRSGMVEMSPNGMAIRGGVPQGAPQHSSSRGRFNDATNLFVFHLPPDWCDADLHHHFGKFGPIQSVKVAVDNVTGLSRGFGFVCYQTYMSALAAIQGMNGYVVGRKRLKVELKRQDARRDVRRPPRDTTLTPQ
ncbi:unnamed protein product [Vitrella brassicaformis CCMP3155]|uniref:RRM domain-containing protein n=1 Tax=Vitrella brassicaformis (strain CCMP3155) TaxID=1169540 RepID=A0A0G4FFE2_VITBC|nr:unnamed protein product [Vitrella brassicaformis CCMP3155]|eukprot:CEM11797.1 unnamed protein product [Vitrella brassicaformis CCMP3155]